MSVVVVLRISRENIEIKMFGSEFDATVSPRPSQHTIELADVARPITRAEQSECVVRQTRHLSADTDQVHLAEKVLSEWLDVLPAFAQRRNRNSDGAELRQEVASKCLVGDESVQGTR